ncbi:MAG TPA: glycerol-3-phosphate acyltransferase [Candidatus Bipolaricaulis sp.]|nr:glycerol-3-phosphate acyltransferase [Candidatus Bipolaricaulis sp.]HRS13857.1 glycerol-3-phosphate acyltransferase [Candidatus Bipolaricaulis sp.]HRU21435.1 glycerol-3-phosphate acyltransferase [Candidatus Bipolaricaulis sp.]
MAWDRVDSGDGRSGRGSPIRGVGMTVLLFVLLGFGLGSLPFAVWVGKVWAKTDVRARGDGNPGAVNAWRAGGWRVGLLALVLDVTKGALPVALARSLGGLGGWALLPVALAPLLGHAFSPWLAFQGGKAVASTFGAWSALTYWEVPTALGLSFALIRTVQAVDGWTVILSFPVVAVYLILRRAEPWLLATLGANFALLVWTHRRELRSPPRWRPRGGST